ncbi:3604_t:CDS:2, partial [Cetraspora pellucida]
VNFYRDVKIIITVPLNFSEGAKDIIRFCVSQSQLVESATSARLEFILERMRIHILTYATAAAIYCINNVKQTRLKPHTNFMLVDIGGGTVLTAIYKLSSDGKACELVEYSSSLCGVTYIDKEFIRYLCDNFDLFYGLQQLQIHNYDQLQFLAQEFCKKAKLPFTGDPSTFKPISIDLEDTCPAIVKYVTGDVREQMIDAEWLIELGYYDVKAMFDPVVERIISHIGNHLSTAKSKCEAMFLVGGGSENQYIQDQLKSAFNQNFSMIGNPKQPITATVRGAVQYQLEKNRPVQYRSNMQNNILGVPRGSVQYPNPNPNLSPVSYNLVKGVQGMGVPNDGLMHGLENKMQNINISQEGNPITDPFKPGIRAINMSQGNSITDPFKPDTRAINISQGTDPFKPDTRAINISQEGNPITDPFKPGSRALRYTYGVQVVMKWKKGDPIHRKNPSGYMNVFYALIKANTVVKVGQTVGYVARPSDPNQKDMTFNIYVSPEINPRFCDEPGMKHYGTLKVDLSDTQAVKKRLVEFSLVFGTTDVRAIAKNKKTGMIYQATLSS